MLLSTAVLNTTTTETLRITETAQVWYTHATYSVILWIPYVSTLSVLDDHTATPYWQITTQTTIYGELYWRC